MGSKETGWAFSSWVPKPFAQHLENLPQEPVCRGSAEWASVHLLYWIRPELGAEAVTDYFGRGQ